jgi:inner membrane transporter RhtA
VRRDAGLVLLAAFSVHFGAAFAVVLFDRLGPGGAVFLRLGFAAVVLLALVRPSLRGRSAKDIRLAIAFGAVLGLMNWSFYEALDLIPLGPAVTLEFLGPLTVAVIGSRRPLDLVWVALAAGGVVLLADPFGSGGLDARGVALALGAGTCWAFYIVLAARTGRAWPGASGLAVAMVFGALVAAPAGVVQGGMDLLHPALLAGGLLVALASSVIPYSLELEALRTLPNRVFGVMMSLDPAVAATAGFVILGQDLAAGDVLAIAMVVIASAGAASERRLPSRRWQASPSATAD